MDGWKTPLLLKQLLIHRDQVQVMSQLFNLLISLTYQAIIRLNGYIERVCPSEACLLLFVAGLYQINTFMFSSFDVSSQFRSVRILKSL